MIQVAPQMKILVAVDPVDFRGGIDRLAQHCRQILEEDPFGGTLFVFRNRRGTSIRVLTFDSQGFWLCTKRLSQGRFKWWPETTGETGHRLEAHQLQLLLWNGNPSMAQAAPAWRPLPVHG